MSNKWEIYSQSQQQNSSKKEGLTPVNIVCVAIMQSSVGEGGSRQRNLTIPDITWTIRAIRMRRGNNKPIVVRVCLIMENY